MSKTARDCVNEARRVLGLRPLVAGFNDPGDHYREWEHPRDKNGQWIEKGGMVRIGDTIAGTVDRFNPDGRVTVRVTESDNPKDIGTKMTAPNDEIEVIDSKATLPGEDAKPPRGHHTGGKPAGSVALNPKNGADVKSYDPQNVQAARSLLSSNNSLSPAIRARFRDMDFPFSWGDKMPSTLSRFVQTAISKGLVTRSGSTLTLTPLGQTVHDVLNGKLDIGDDYGRQIKEVKPRDK